MSLLTSKYIALNILPSPIEANAKALRHKSSHYFPSHMSPSASQHNIGPSFSQPNIAYHANCINYNPSTRIITVSCSPPGHVKEAAKSEIDKIKKGLKL